MVFLLYSSVPLIYAQYNFSPGETGTVFLTGIVGAFFGVFAARWQDRLYQRDAERTVLGIAAPESRLYAARVGLFFRVPGFWCDGLTVLFGGAHQMGGVIVPISLFWFAWSGRPEVHWIVPSIALAFFNFGLL